MSKGHVLIVDDQEQNRYLTEALLKGSGYTTHTVGNGSEALAYLSTQAVDLIISDVLMPVMDGLEATRSIRSLERERRLPPTPIVLLTAHALYEFEVKGRQAGCDSFLTKPIRKARLLEHLYGILDSGPPA